MRTLNGAISVSLLLLVTAGLVHAQSQPPPPRGGVLSNQEKSQTQKHGNNTNTDQRGTDYSPIVVKMAPSPNAKEEAAQAKNEKEEKAATDRRIEITTYIVAGSTAIQAIALIYTIFVLIKTAKVTKESVDAVQRSERPYVFVIPKIMAGYPPEHWNTRAMAPTEYTITLNNHGKTPAVLTYFKGGIVYNQRDYPQKFVGPVEDNNMIPAGEIIAAGGSNEYPYNLPTIGDIFWQNIVGEIMPFRCVGIVRYKDIFGVEHETGFCWEFQRRKSNFYLSPNRELNYYT